MAGDGHVTIAQPGFALIQALEEEREKLGASKLSWKKELSVSSVL